MTELIPPLLPLLVIMFGVLLFVTYLPEIFMWLLLPLRAVSRRAAGRAASCVLSSPVSGGCL